jgi:hypothetical protein
MWQKLHSGEKIASHDQSLPRQTTYISLLIVKNILLSAKNSWGWISCMIFQQYHFFNQK